MNAEASKACRKVLAVRSDHARVERVPRVMVMWDTAAAGAPPPAGYKTMQLHVVHSRNGNCDELSGRRVVDSGAISPVSTRQLYLSRVFFRWLLPTIV